MSNSVYYRNHHICEFLNIASSMSVNTPVHHPWCWVCHSFGRFNCFLFHLLQQKQNTAPAIGESDQLPLHLCRGIGIGQVNSGAECELLSGLEEQKRQASHESKSKSTKIAYFEIEIRPNVRNVPPNLNRFIPYREFLFILHFPVLFSFFSPAHF